jgi:hypothetical protein
MSGRPVLATPEGVVVKINEQALEEVRGELNELVRIESQMQTNARYLAERIGYALPADSADPDLIQRDIVANMRRSVEAVLEVGRALLVLKEVCAHGEFLSRLDVLGIEHRVARRFMQSAFKFSNRATSPVLVAAKSQSKLFEMLVLDDEQIEELELTGHTGDLSLDDVATMSVKDLRAALREARANSEAKARLMAEKDEKITKLLVTQGRKIALDIDWPDALIPLCEQIAAVKREIDHAFSKLETARIGVLQTEMSEDQRPKFEAALRHVAEVYASALETAERRYLKEQVVFAQTLGAFLEDD